jgi:hypothetical protein
MRISSSGKTGGKLAGMGFALAAGLLLVAVAAPPAHAQSACTCEGGFGPQVIPNVMQVGNDVTIDLCYTNTAKVSGQFTANVEVDLTGTVYTRMACTDEDCLDIGGAGDGAAELGSTLTFDGCIATPTFEAAFTNVVSCGIDAVNDGGFGNAIAVVLDADGVHLGDGETVCIARILATATEPVPFLDGVFLTRVATDSDSIVVAEPGDTCSNNGDTCGTTGTTSSTFMPICEVEVDKQVSCDGGATFVDVGFGDNAAESCAGWNAFDEMEAEPIVVRYEARNGDNATLNANCELTESNGMIGDPNDPGLIALGQTFSFEDDDQACSDALAANEPDTATLSCECTVNDGVIEASDTDSADFSCLEPRLQVEKQCIDTNDNSGADAVEIQVMNIADENTADLINCELTDTLDTNEPSANCPGDGEGLENVPLLQASFDLPAGTQHDTSGTFGDRLTASCNTASVTCEIDGSGGKMVTADDSVPCEPIECNVRLDKVLIVDGQRIDEGDFEVRVEGQGISWAGFDGNDPDPVSFEFIIENTGEADAECELVDTAEGGEELVNQIVQVAAGETETVTLEETCRAEVAGLDTATIACTCIDSVGGEFEVDDEDSAEVLCLTPGLNVVKECRDFDPVDGADDQVHITVMNDGDANLVNCQVTDVLDENEESCPGNGADLTPVEVSPQGFSLTPGNDQVVTGSFNVTASACNEVEVTCTIEGTAKTVTAMDDEFCFIPPPCVARFDKQVSCDGVNFVDAEDNDDPNNATTRSCVGWNAFDGMEAEPASRRFIVENTGSGVIECSIVDDLNGNQENFGPFQVAVGATQVIDDPGTCGADVAGVDTATLSCTCLNGSQLPVIEETPFVDSAEIECQTPALQVSKVCEDQVDGRNAIEIQVTNPASADGATLANCVVSDPLAPECDGPVTSPLAPGDSDTVLCGVDGLTETTLNEVSVTCDIPGTSKEISDGDAAECKVTPDQCLHKTPGFWCTHPTVTNLFLDLQVCGIPIDNVQVKAQGSAIEDLRSPGKDHKLVSSPQKAQLIRQCTAAALNQAASAANEGSCEGEPVGDSTFGAVFASCCDDLCANDASAGQINASGCIGLLDDFNNTPEDTFAETPPPFDNLGNAFCPVPDGTDPELAPRCNGQPDRCKAAGGNGFVNSR